MELALTHLRRARSLAAGLSQVSVEVPPAVRLARTDFSAFCALLGKPNAEHHRQWVEQFVTGQSSAQLLGCAGPNTAVLAPRGPLDVDTPVLTPDGYRPLRDIRPGDQVYAADGTPTQVLAAIDYGEQECFRVHLSDGTSVVCDDSHRWDVRRMGSDEKGQWRTVTLQEIRQFVTDGMEGNWRTGVARRVRLAEPGEKPWLDGRGHARYQVPIADAVQFPERDLPLDPYLLGTLLALDKGGVIPAVYLVSSVAQRTALLQGLLDTDGTCKKQTGRGGVSFGTSSRQLMDDIKELARSLGALVLEKKAYQSFYRKPDGTKVMCRMAYRCSFRFPPGLMPFHCEAKGQLYQGPASGKSNGGMTRSIVDIEPVGLRPVRCITIAHPDELFLTDGCVCIKNSAKSTVLGLLCAWLIGVHAQAGKMLRMLYLGYSLDIARSRSHTIKAIIGSKAYQEVFPMVRLSKTRQSDELWAIDYEYAGIEAQGDDPYTMVGQGLSGSITSRRSQLIVLDDVVKSSESIQNPEIRRKLITNWQEVVQPTLLEGGRCIALGTRFSTVDIFATTFNEKNNWHVMTQQAIVTGDDGLEKSYWPEFYTMEHLRKLRAEDPISFSFQFQNQPVSRSEIDFPADWLKPAVLTESYDMLAVGIDLSTGLKERNDFTVMTLGGVLGDRVEVIDFRRVRSMGNLEKLDELCALLADWGVLVENDSADGPRWLATDVPVTLNIEAISYQQSMQADAKQILLDDRKLHNISIRAVTGYRGDKLTRFRGTLGLFQTGRVTWNRWINWDPFWQELMNLGSAEHDDCVDSFVLLIRALIGTGRLQPSWGEWDEA